MLMRVTDEGSSSAFFDLVLPSSFPLESCSVHRPSGGAIVMKPLSLALCFLVLAAHQNTAKYLVVAATGAAGDGVDTATLAGEGVITMGVGAAPTETI